MSHYSIYLPYFQQNCCVRFNFISFVYSRNNRERSLPKHICFGFFNNSSKGHLHVDEATPHVHVRRVWFVEDEKTGHEIIGKNKALEELGIAPPRPDKSIGRYNNAKMTLSHVFESYMSLTGSFHHQQSCVSNVIKLKRIDSDGSICGRQSRYAWSFDRDKPKKLQLRKKGLHRKRQKSA